MVNPVNGFEAKLPWAATAVDDADSKTVNNQWYLLFQALFNRTGAGTGLWTLTVASISDFGEGQSSAEPCPANLVFVNAQGLGGGVSLPSGTPGNIVMVMNKSLVNATNVYPSPDPPGGASIDIAAPNAPYILQPGKTQFFIWETATQIWTIAL